MFNGHYRISSRGRENLGDFYIILFTNSWLEAGTHPEEPSFRHLGTHFLVFLLSSCKYWDDSVIPGSQRMRLLHSSLLKLIKMEFVSVDATKLNNSRWLQNLAPLPQATTCVNEAHPSYIGSQHSRLTVNFQAGDSCSEPEYNFRKWRTKSPVLIFLLKLSLLKVKVKVNMSCTRHGGVEWRYSSTHSISILGGGYCLASRFGRLTSG